MNDTLNATLAIARQTFDELVQLTPIDKLRALELGEGAKRKRVDTLLESMNKLLGSIEHNLAQITDPPLAEVPATHIVFFRETLEPSAKLLRTAYWESIGLRDVFESIEEFMPQPASQATRKAIEWGLERWRDMLDAEELAGWEERGFAIESAINLVESPLFEPDRWQENLWLLRSVLVDRPPQHVRNHVRHRLTEIYRTFTFGLWMSSIALCRSLLEYALKETAPRFNIDTTRTNVGGVSEDRSLKQLCDDFARRFPSLSVPLETVRDSGNRIMHAKKRDVIAFPKVLRSESLDCIRSTRQTLETVYVSAAD